MNRRIVKSEAVVLKRMDYLDSSRIVTLYTKAEGKVSVLARGARSRNNRFGSALEPGTVAQVVYYSRPHRELQTLTQADVRERFREMSGSMARLTGAFHVLDLANAVTDPGQAHPEFFDLLVSALHAVTKDDAGLPAVLLGYKLKVYHLSGFAPGLSSCIQCGKAHVAQGSAQSVLFDIRQGGALCQTCTRHGTPDRLEPLAAPHSRVKIGIDRLVWMQHLLSADFLEYAEDPIPEGMWNELDGLMRLYEKQHVLHGRTLKTDSMLREFIG